MVTLVQPLLLPADSPGHGALWTGLHLTESQRSRLDALGARALRVLEPLLHLRTERELEVLLPAAAERFLLVKKEVLQVLMESAEALKDLNDLYRRATSAVEDVARARVDMLGQEAAEQFMGAFESLTALRQRVLSAIEEGGPEMERMVVMVQMTAEAVGRADAAMGAVIMALFDAVQDWEPEALALLCRAADHYMTQVEDQFLADVAEDLKGAETVPVESVRKELGL